MEKLNINQEFNTDNVFPEIIKVTEPLQESSAVERAVKAQNGHNPTFDTEMNTMIELGKVYTSKYEN